MASKKKNLLYNMLVDLFRETPRCSAARLKQECGAINSLEAMLQLISVVTKLNTPGESGPRTTIRLLNVFPNMGSSMDLLMGSRRGVRRGYG